MSRYPSTHGGGSRSLFRPGPRRLRPVRYWLLCGGCALLAYHVLTGIGCALWPLSHPARGVVCDRVMRVCATAAGLSVPATTRWLGEVAGRQLDAYRARGGDLRRWQFSNGVTCDAVRSRCWQSPGRQAVLTGLSGELFLTGHSPDALSRADEASCGSGCITNTRREGDDEKIQNIRWSPAAALAVERTGFCRFTGYGRRTQGTGTA
ncbi:hypothetical protein DEO48_25620 [Enterobacter sp. CGMCC 5087]|uniref:YcgJ family protein n=1 Tax=Enterobacter sp. CGMCC 5087 TaxID=2183878 RepID=UPI000D673F78|nr:hypothetical protein DEO48_25620 [Enterobacter sp. CGMCC 5087]